MSFASQKIWPQKRGNDGKHSEPRMPARSMSTTRAIGSYAAGRISEYGTGVGVNSSLRFPTVTESPEVGTRLVLVHPGVVGEHPRADVAVLRGQPVDPDVRRFDHVVVDRDQPVELGCVRVHGLPPAGIAGARPCVGRPDASISSIERSEC